MTITPSGVRSFLLAALHSVISSFAWGVYFCLFLLAAPLSVMLIPFLVGVPTTVGLLAVVREAAEIERRASNRLLGTSIDPAIPWADLGSTRWERLVTMLRSASTWRAVVFLLVRTMLGFLAMLGLLVGGVSALALGVVPLIDGIVVVDNWHSSAGWTGLWAVPVAVAFSTATMTGAAVLGWISARTGEILLGPSRKEKVYLLERAAADLGARQVLARELHDLVGHSMSTVVVQAGAARRVGADNVEFADRALGDIEDVARRSLEELDGMLALLREGDQSDLAALGSSGPTLADLDTLADAVRAVGVPLVVSVDGDLKLLDREVSATAYRVIQEALTNVIRHAGATMTTVDLVVAGRSVTVEVVNAAPAAGHRRLPRPGRRGRGLQGLTERVGQLGGRVDFGDDDGGFRLRAILPLTSRAARSDDLPPTP
jgi:signal transduction histidine kinase